MDFNPRLLEIFQETNTDLSSVMGDLYCFSPRELSERNKDEIREYLKDQGNVTFIVGLKPTVIEVVKMLLSTLGTVTFFPDISEKSRHLTLSISGQILNPTPDEVWSKINYILEKDQYLESWDVKVNGETVFTIRPGLDKEVQSNIKRERVITSDDVMDLKIALGRYESVDDFINSL